MPPRGAFCRGRLKSAPTAHPNACPFWANGRGGGRPLSASGNGGGRVTPRRFFEEKRCHRCRACRSANLAEAIRPYSSRSQSQPSAARSLMAVAIRIFV